MVIINLFIHSDKKKVEDLTIYYDKFMYNKPQTNEKFEFLKRLDDEGSSLEESMGNRENDHKIDPLFNARSIRECQ